jgi:hypothetical protein
MTASGTSKWREWYESLEVLAVTGFLFAGLFLASLLLVTGEPPLEAGAAEVERWFSDPNRLARALTGLNLAPVSIIAFLWFMAVFRQRLGAAGGTLVATVFLGSGLLFAALYLSGVAALASGAVMVEYAGLEPALPAWQLARALGTALLSVHAARMGAVFVITTATLGLRSGALMKPTAVVGYGLGAAMLIGAVFREPSPYLLPAWVAIASLDLLRRRKLLLERLHRAKSER